MKTLIALLGSSCLALSGCQHAPPPPAATTARASDDHIQSIRTHTDALFEKLVAVRRSIHQHPELAGDETRTAATVAAYLRQLGLEVQTGLYGHSVVAVLRGARPGRTIAWRADLDALPGFYPDPEAFRSTTPSVHHACGHDIHIAVALGIAEVLAQHRASLAGNVVFVFQPEEETFKGAKAMLEHGVFATGLPDEIYGMHVTAFPAGEIRVRPGEMFAYQRRVQVTLRDELSAAEVDNLVKRVQRTMFRARTDAKPWEIQRLVDTTIGISAPDTAFQDYSFMDADFHVSRKNGLLHLEANLYATDRASVDTALNRIGQVVEASGHRRQLVATSFALANPTVVNDERLTGIAVQTLWQSFGEGAVKPLYGQVPYFNDDFAYFQQKIPGVYFFLGGSNADKGMIAFNHAPNFQVDEESIRVAVRSFSALILSRGHAGNGNF